MSVEWVKKAAAKAEPVFETPPEQVDDTIPGRRVLVDADYLCYFAAGGDAMPISASRKVALERLLSVKELTGAETVELHLTHRGSDKGERFLIAETKPYQGQRNKSRRPKNWEPLREYLEGLDFAITPYSFVKRFNWQDREADDGFALRAYTAIDPVSTVVHHTRDKDMRMLPGTHLTWVNFEQVIVPTGAWEVRDSDGLIYGEKWFWLQMLTGDTADNIPGLDDVGEVKSQAILSDVFCTRQAQAIVFEQYRQQYGERAADRFVETAALLWLRKSSDVIDFLRTMEPTQEILDAAYRMAARVEEQREALNRFESQT